MATDSGKQPYGQVSYADPGYQADKKKRYPIDTADHVRAAWSYINKPANAGKYSAEQVSSIKGKIKSAAKKLGIDIAEDSSSKSPDKTPVAASRAVATTNTFMRSFPLEDINIKGGNGGRTVEAYAAVFDRQTEIHDHEGHYIEEIDRSAFNKAVNDARPSGARRTWNVGVFYNHGLTIHGTPADGFSLPLGVVEDIKPESKGLLTVTRYSETPLADQILTMIRDGSITAQSFTGRVVRSVPSLSRGDRYRPSRDGELRVVRRTELGLKEYGPTPFPAYSDAAILGVRATFLKSFLEDDDLYDEETGEVERTEDVGTSEENTEECFTKEAAVEEPGIKDDHSHRHELFVMKSREAREALGITFD